MTTSTGPYRKRLAGVALVMLSLGLSACTGSGEPTMGMTPPASIGGGGLSMPAVSSAPQPDMQPAPSASASLPVQSAAPQPLPAQAQTTTAGIARRSASVQFLPVVGAPPEKVAMLSEALSRSAAQKGVTILPSGSGTAPLRLKGYLSALGEGRETIVVYVWDVVDETGNRVSRIQGQERVSGNAADPWDSVGEAPLAAIAGRTIDEFLSAGPAAG